MSIPRIMKTKYVFNVKKDKLGYSQLPDIDFQETASPVLSKDEFRLLLAIGASNNLNIHQYDIKSIFLAADAEENLYVNVPKGLDWLGIKQFDNKDIICLKLEK